MIIIDTCILLSSLQMDSNSDRVARWLRSLPELPWLPVVVMMEMIAAKTNETAALKMADDLERSFRLIAFDAAAARESGRIVAAAGGVAACATSRPNLSKSAAKQQVRTDAAILATAIVNQQVLYTLDDGIRRLAIAANVADAVADVPNIAEQPDLALPGEAPRVVSVRPRRHSK